uniref:Uncharacterized protein n=1 Tax=Anguilla anguilla TaxID=7936 RepID=A0A0E9R198_ANGAN
MLRLNEHSLYTQRLMPQDLSCFTANENAHRLVAQRIFHVSQQMKMPIDLMFKGTLIAKFI